MRLREASQRNPLIAAGLDVAAVASPAVAAVLTGVRGPAFDPRQPDQIGPALGEAAGQLAGTATAAIPGAGPFIAPVARPALGAAGATAGLAAERAIRGQEQPSAARPGFETGIS